MCRTLSLLILIALLSFAEATKAQKVWSPYLVVFKRFPTNGEIPFYLQYVEGKDLLGVYGIFDSAYIFNDKGTSVAKVVPNLSNTLKYDGTTWKSAGDVKFVSSDDRSMVLFHNKIKGSDYVSTYGYHSPPYFWKLNTSTNKYEGVPELDFYQYSRTLRFYEWGSNILFIGDFSYINTLPYQTIALWNPQTNTLSGVGGTPVTGSSITSISVSPKDSTIGFALYDTYRILRKGETAFATGYLPLPKSNAQVEVADKDNLYASFNVGNTNSEVYRYTTASHTWQKILTFAAKDANTNPKVESMLYRNGTLYIGGQFDSANGKPCFHIIQYNESTGQTTNVGASQMGNIDGCGMYGVHLAWNNNTLYGFADDCIVFGVQSLYAFRDTSNTLPISLIEFIVGKNGKENVLKWTTSKENKAVRFEVEEGTDGKNFNTIGNVTSGGFGGGNRSYSYTDKAPFGHISYYRLKSIDGDGRSEYSNIQSIRNTDGFDVQLRSNVVKSDLALQFTTTATEKITLRIVDVSGRIVQSHTFSIEEGTTTKKLQTAALKKGIYCIQVVSSSASQTLKFMQQ